MTGRDLVLVDMESLDTRVYVEFYPYISPKQRKRLMNCIRRNAVHFEDETSINLMGLSREEFLLLSDSQKFAVYGNLVGKFCGSQAELEELQQEIEKERAEISKKAW